MRWTPRASDAGVTALLGGATRKWARPRGFANWMPRPDTATLLAQVQTVLAEYQAYLPLTIRQIFYRLVGAHGYEKTDHAYGRLCEHLNRARRARLIDMDAIRDDGITAIGGPGWASIDEYVDSLRRRAKYFRLDRTAGQTNHLVVLCEAAGMAPQLAEVTGPYDIKVMSGGGFDSLTAKYEFATELACPPQARAKALDQIAANVSWLSRKYPERPMEVRELYDILQRLADVIITPDLVQ
jgi:hypothetical protein